MFDPQTLYWGSTSGTLPAGGVLPTSFQTKPDGFASLWNALSPSLCCTQTLREGLIWSTREIQEASEAWRQAAKVKGSRGQLSHVILPDIEVLTTSRCPSVNPSGTFTVNGSPGCIIDHSDDVFAAISSWMTAVEALWRAATCSGVFPISSVAPREAAPTLHSASASASAVLLTPHFSSAFSSALWLTTKALALMTRRLSAKGFGC